MIHIFLPFSIAKSHIKERELRDDISKLREDHLDLVSKLHSLKKEQVNSFASNHFLYLF